MKPPPTIEELLASLNRPMPFSMENAELMLETLDAVLNDLGPADA